jgi:mono/diheme cytochrome c family protein
MELMPLLSRCLSPRLAPSIGASLLLIGLLSGCRQDMHDQPKMFPLRSTTLFPDGRSVRPQVENTVGRSQLESSDYFTTGMVNGAEADGLPFKVTQTVLRRGQERYNIYCTPCHSRVGNGKGMIVQRGYYQATSFHSDRLRRAPLGHFFSVMTNGYGAMPDYAAQLSPQDRWAVAAYIRALQLSQSATKQDVSGREAVLPIDTLAEQSGLSKTFLDQWLNSSQSQAAVLAVPSSQAIDGGPTKPVANMPAGVTSSQGAPGDFKAHPTAVVTATKGDAGKGKKIYAENCSVCHQPTRTGMPPVFPSLLGVVDRVGEARVRTVARTGIPDAKPPMPPHPNLSDKDINDLLAFLRTK